MIDIVNKQIRAKKDYSNITKDKIYNVQLEAEGWYYIKMDNGKIGILEQELFETLEIYV